jgi:hypothetical protein
MKDTNAIDKAIRQKCEKEIWFIVDNFLNEIETKLRGEYNATSFYYLNSRNTKAKITVMGMDQLKNVLNSMLIEGHIEAMLSVKSRELIKKLELL